MRLPDLTLGVRNLIRRPGFAVTAILLLALGAGANAAVFSIVRGVLLRPLPYERSEQLVAIWPNGFVSNEDLAFWRERTHRFQAIGAVSPGWMMALVADGLEPLKVTGARTSDNFFTTLGVPATLGRTLMPGDAVPTRNRVLVISRGLFERHFGSDPRVIGRTVHIDNVAHEIIGVMPRGFEFMEPGTDVWTPLPFDPSSPQHRAQFSQAFARLSDAATVASADEELQALLPSMRHDLKKSDDWGRDARAVPLLPGVESLAARGFVTGASGRNWAGYGRHITLRNVSDTMKALLTDPQTSGGLLVACAPEVVDDVMATFAAEGFARATVIGQLSSGSGVSVEG